MSKSNTPIWQDPRIFEINRSQISASGPRFFDRQSALNGDLSCVQLSLDGIWKFRWIESPDLEPGDFAEADYDDSDWDEIRVPGVWQLQGFGIPHYRNIGLPPGPDEKNPPRIDPALNHLGLYRTIFRVPEGWPAERLILHFGGVKASFEAWLNGSYLGYSQDSMLPVEFEITDFLQKGDNQLAVKVYRFCDGSFLEDQDMWYLNGIFRNVLIYQTPRIRIEDFFLYCEFDEDYQDAQFVAEIQLDLSEAEDQVLSLGVELFDPAGGEVCVLSETIQAGAGIEQVRFEHSAARPLQWSAESPSLYKVLLTLRDQDGSEIQAIPVFFGFRVVEIKEAQLLINGVPVIMRGVNRHDFDPEGGPAVSREFLEAQIKQLKRFNINAVRTAHYPNQSAFYDLCDRYGIYVMDEANLESHNFVKYLPRGKEEWREAVIARGTRMVRRDRNHPSVVIWSLGNEAGSGENFRHLRRAMEEIDPTRPIHYESEYKYPNSDFVSMMYPSPAFLEKVARGNGPLWFFKSEGLAGKPVWPRHYRGKPILVCEYAHAMGNSISRLDRFMKIFEDFPHCAGGYIWDMIDQGLLRTGEDGTSEWTYGGDWGDEPNDGAFCINGLFQPDLKPNPHAYEVQKVYQPVAVEWEGLPAGELFIINRRSFSDLSDLDLRWTLTRDGEVVESERIPAPPVPPGERRILGFPYLDLVRDNGEYHILLEFLLNQDTPWEQEGFRVAWEQLRLSQTQVEPLLKASPVRPPTTPLIIHPRGDRLEILVGEMKLTFQTESGYLVGLEQDSQPLLVGPLRPNFFRAIDNDYLAETFAPELARYLSLNKKWEDAHASLILKDFQVERMSSGKVWVQSSYHLRQGRAPLVMSYQIGMDGVLEVLYELRPRLEMLRFGLQVPISRDLSQTTWYGRGPHETMPDRKTSGMIAVHSLPSDALHFSYIHPQENGSRVDVRWAKFQDKTGSGLYLTAEGGQFFNFSLWPYTQEDLLKARHASELPERDQYTLNIDLDQRGVGDLFSFMYGRDPEARLYKGKTYQLRLKMFPARD